MFRECLVIRQFNKMLESMGEKEYNDMIENFDPFERDWDLGCNPDDVDAALFNYFKDHYDFSGISNAELADIISNAFWNGNTVGFDNSAHLSESRFVPGNRLYYHGGKAGIEEFEGQNSYTKNPNGGIKCIFLSPKRLVAKQFVQRDPPGSLYTCKIDGELNTFNSNNPRDRQVLKKQLKKDFERVGNYWNISTIKEILIESCNGDSSAMEDIRSFIKCNLVPEAIILGMEIANRWVGWEVIELYPVMDAIAKLGYDSFTTFENNVGNIAVIDVKKIRIIKEEGLHESFENDHKSDIPQDRLRELADHINTYFSSIIKDVSFTKYDVVKMSRSSPKGILEHIKHKMYVNNTEGSVDKRTLIESAKYIFKLLSTSEEKGKKFQVGS